jgi:UDP-N-acetyl-D-mannosaminuronate dehydrogenase
LAYKPNVDDLRESPAIEIAKYLAENGADVHTFEPFVPGFAVENCTAEASLDAALAGADAVALLVNHAQFKTIDPHKLTKQMPGRIAIDVQGVWELADWRAAGFNLHSLGVGNPREG